MGIIPYIIKGHDYSSARSGGPILLAEDDENDVFFLKRALKQAGLSGQLFVARDGQEAVSYLSGESPYSDRAIYPLPRLLLLDLKMPRMSGLDVLTWLRKQTRFENLSVVVLSSSNQETDRQKAIQLGADDYHVKPHEFEHLVSLVKTLHQRWMA